MFSYLVQTVNNMYQNVSGKSIENQELILRGFFFAVVSMNWLAHSVGRSITRATSWFFSQVEHSRMK